jgi:cytochrome c-type biogenesis protein CcmH
MKPLSILAICVLLITATAGAMLSFGAQSAPVPEKEREILDNLIAPCCWTQPVSQHYSEVAEKIRKEVHEMVAAGKSRDEILASYVSRYGERILAAPRPKGFNLLVYILPWLALVAGAWLLIILLKKLRTPAAAPAPSPLPDSRYASVIEKEMKDLEE